MLKKRYVVNWYNGYTSGIWVLDTLKEVAEYLKNNNYITNNDICCHCYFGGVYYAWAPERQPKHGLVLGYKPKKIIKEEVTENNFEDLFKDLQNNEDLPF